MVEIILVATPLFIVVLIANQLRIKWKTKKEQASIELFLKNLAESRRKEHSWIFDGWGRYRLFLDRDGKSVWDDQDHSREFSPLSWVLFVKTGCFYSTFPGNTYEIGKIIGLSGRATDMIIKASDTPGIGNDLRDRISSTLEIPTSMCS